MRVGVFTALLANLSLDQVIEKLKGLGVEHRGTGHRELSRRPALQALHAREQGALKEFKQKLDDNGITISALSCHGEPLHPDPAIAKANQEVSRKTILLAEKLGVPVVVDFSGCPGDSDKAKYPNWVTCPWPPHFQEILDWQWEKKVIPYWTSARKFAADHGVKIALEMHPGFVVYSPETMLRLRAIAGPNIGCNYDPSHMFWQGIDPIAAIRVLGDCHLPRPRQGHPDLHVQPAQERRARHQELHRRAQPRSWIFRTVGYGHGAEWWREFISTLRMYGYDYVLSIEHEDSLMSAEEGLTKAVRFLNEIVIKEKPGVAFWA